MQPQPTAVQGRPRVGGVLRSGPPPDGLPQAVADQPRLPLLIREYTGRREYERHARLLLADGWHPWTVTERAGRGLRHTLTFGLWSRLFRKVTGLRVTYASAGP